MAPRSIKLVICGDSGVGKTSIRSQYISGRFSTGYRATIGTDFITKTLPHYKNAEESVTLQIWDTAGQERFSSLSTAFFRGADAVMLVFDVNKPETLEGIRKWWAEFRDRAPVSEHLQHEFACVVVGNKVDLATGSSKKKVVSEDEARLFLEELVPIPSRPASGRLSNGHRELPFEGEIEADAYNTSPIQSDSIDIRGHRSRGSYGGSRATSRSRFGGTMTTTHTNFSVYHTAASSMVDSPISPVDDASTPLRFSDLPRSSSPSPVAASRRNRVHSGASVSTAATITPSLFARASSPPPDPPPSPAIVPPESEDIPPPDEGPRLYFTSAKTGQHVADVFEYIARRVVSRWEWEESLESRQIDALDYASGPNSTTNSTIRLGHPRNGSKWNLASTPCCLA